MTFDNVLSWALKARPGEELIYHKGNLLTEFQNGHDFPDAVWGARFCYNGGVVTLTKRKDAGQHFYIAQRNKEICPPEPAFGKDTTIRVDRFKIPFRFHRNSSFAHKIDGRWDGEAAR
jgi:hypothetical protein